MTNCPCVQPSNPSNTAAEPPQCSSDQPTHIPINTDFFIQSKKVGQLDGWIGKGVKKNLNPETIESKILKMLRPPWMLIPSRMTAEILDVSLQTLTVWRMRDLGPPVEPMLKKGGNRMYYRPDRLWCWLMDCPEDTWKISAKWLQKMDWVDKDLSETDFRQIQESLDDTDVFPAATSLWLKFRK